MNFLSNEQEYFQVIKNQINTDIQEAISAKGELSQVIEYLRELLNNTGMIAAAKDINKYNYKQYCKFIMADILEKNNNSSCPELVLSIALEGQDKLNYFRCASISSNKFQVVKE